MNDVIFSSWGGQVVDNRGRGPKDYWPAGPVKLPEEFAKDEKIKALIGWGGIIIRSAEVDIVDLCREYMEAVQAASCGKCVPCRTGTRIMADILERICRGSGVAGDMVRLKQLAQTVQESAKCGIGQTGPVAVLDALEYFAEAFEAAIDSRTPAKGSAYHSRVTAPCMQACPIHLDIPAYVESIREGKFAAALETIRERLPLPGTVGRVCVRPCEANCRRALLDEAISIKYLKRFVADDELSHRKQPEYRITPSAKTGKVAVVGAGPAGLTCAFHLARRGHRVTIFERLAEPGGMSAVGIPDYRLPRPILRGEAGGIQKMGVEIRYGTTVGKDIGLPQLAADFDAVFIGIGAQGSSAMRVEGEDQGYAGFIPGIRYLLDINEGRDPYPEGKKVVVIGGGNVAIDCVRSSFRIGKPDVHLIYRRTRNEMPADAVEIHDAEEEKVVFHFLTTPVRVLAENGKVVGLECIRMKLGEPDASGRRRPVPVVGSEFVFDCDTVVPAIGQQIDLSLLEATPDLKTTRWNTLAVDEVTKQSSRPKIFSAGDCETGPGALITACAGGRRAAESIDRLINGLPLETGEDRSFDKLFATVGVYAPDERLGIAGRRPRRQLEMLPPEKRKFSFDEVEAGYPPPEAVTEASRCLRCYRVATVAV